MVVTEIYEGIEGEGVRIGVFQLFIRLFGCKVGCKTCDTKYTWGKATPENSFQITPNKLFLDYILPSNADWISITGGDPLLQSREVAALIDQCRQNINGKHKFINIEATGLNDCPLVFNKCDFISADIKTPNTGVSVEIDTIYKLYRAYQNKIQFKAVIANDEDIQFIKQFRGIPVVITPCWEPGSTLCKENLNNIQKLLKECPEFRMIVQQHKFLYGVDAKSV